MSKQTTRFPPRCARNFFESLLRCAFSMTKIMSDHARTSGVTGLPASFPRPADCVSMPGRSEKTCSAVGLRSRFCVQMKRTFLDKPNCLSWPYTLESLQRSHHGTHPMFSVDPSGRVNHALLFTLPGQPAPVDE